MKYVLGNNVVSYFVSYVLDIPIIKHKTLEIQDGNHGPDIIPEKLLELTKLLFEDCTILEYERFYSDRGKFTSKKPTNFNNIYSLYTRGKTITENSYLNQLKKYQKYVSVSGLGPEESFNALMLKIKENVNKNCIDKQVKEITFDQKLRFDDSELEYNSIISTINLVDLVELQSSGKIRDSIIENYNLDGFNLPYNDKFIYTCELTSEEDKVLSGIYKQVLATGQPYYKKTYIGDKIIYECMRNIYDNEIEENKILNYFETTQISDNLNLSKVSGIDLLGKFSQWTNNINLETLYNNCLELKEFYNSSENNHKKVL